MTRSTLLIFWFSLAMIASIGLYSTSYRVHDLDKQLIALNEQIDAEQRNIHVLKAEWVYLANPTRIERAAKKYLSLHPTSMQQIAKLNKMPDASSSDSESVTAPLASIGTTLSAQPRTHQIASRDDLHINTRLVISRAVKSLDSSAVVQSPYGIRP